MIFEETLSVEDTWRNNRVQMAIELKKLPSEIDAMPLTDAMDLLDIMEFNKIQNERHRRRTA